LCDIFFFFQAEDGIRNKLVTGVQTCALPISTGSGVGALAVQADVSILAEARHLIDAAIRRFRRVDFLVCNAGIWEGAPVDEMEEESEERRVGKECRSRWAPEREKKKDRSEGR